MVEPCRGPALRRAPETSLLNFPVTTAPDLDQSNDPLMRGGWKVWEASMHPKRPKRVSRKPRLKLLAAVNQGDRWILLPGGGFGLTVGEIPPRSAA